MRPTDGIRFGDPPRLILHTHTSKPNLPPLPNWLWGYHPPPETTGQLHPTGTVQSRHSFPKSRVGASVPVAPAGPAPAATDYPSADGDAGECGNRGLGRSQQTRPGGILPSTKSRNDPSVTSEGQLRRRRAGNSSGPGRCQRWISTDGRVEYQAGSAD